MPHYPGHLAYLEEAATQLAIGDRSLVDQARRLQPLANLSSLIGQAYEARRNPLHRDVDLVIAKRQAVVLELALTAARAILLQANADLTAGAPAELNHPDRPNAFKRLRK